MGGQGRPYPPHNSNARCRFGEGEAVVMPSFKVGECGTTRERYQTVIQ